MKHWYRDFFNEHALDVWQQSRSEDLTAAEVDFLASALDLSGSGSLLDLASGNGRHAAELAARGYALTCVDIAEGNRARIEARAAAAGASVVIVIGDLTEIELAPSRYGGAYLWGNSLGYFPAAETAAFFARVAAALAPGARFAVESAVVAECILGDLSRRTWFEIADDMQVMLASSYEPRESRLDTIYTSVRDGVVVDRSTAHVWVFTCREVIAMAAAAGLALVDLCGGLDGAPFELGDDQLIAVFEKL